MKTKILGKIITKNYSIKFEKDDDGVFKYKPLFETDGDVKFEEIMSVEGELKFNENLGGYSFVGIFNKINISEDTEVSILKQTYRADVDSGTMFAYTDHIIETIENDITKEIVENEFKMTVQEYYTQKIESDKKILDYCEVHNIDIGNADYEKLHSIVYPLDYDGMGIIIHKDRINGNCNSFTVPLTIKPSWYLPPSPLSTVPKIGNISNWTTINTGGFAYLE
jgi:hypothetical protein